MASLLVLWDVDHTLLNAGGGGIRVYAAALREMFGLELPAEAATVPMAGRTDRAIAVDLLAVSGVADPRARVDEFQAVQADCARRMQSLFRASGRVLPGARDALASLAEPRPGLHVVQSLLTGNVRGLAEIKLGAVGLTEHLDLDAGAYGTESEVRADLVAVARRNAAKRYGEDFGGAATVLVGDTPLDVQAALAADARAIGVATGNYNVAELRAAGAHVALPDLADTASTVGAILGPLAA